ncbi:1277_t:CDS:1 [Scutellospora calospora]|uniref:1277_t:CDS:1 n=1 Tax=Scutellospora calospora TaxID=85575 RepID=A0ACA9NZK5_9GLOM|nr:1277_t:CDS:1 [Scutellospora calospora]
MNSQQVNTKLHKVIICYPNDNLKLMIDEKKMKIFKKIINKLFNKKSNTFNSDDSWDQSPYSTSNKKNSWYSLLLVEEENQSFEIEIFKIVYSQKYIVFTEYKKFKEYLIKEQIISNSLKNYENIKNKRLQNILSFLEAHIRSYFYIFNKGYKYALMNNTQDLNTWRVNGYQKDFEFWFNIINNECKKFEIKYLFSYDDLEKYNNEYLAF